MLNPKNKVFTVREFIDNIEKNGLVQTYNKMFAAVDDIDNRVTIEFGARSIFSGKYNTSNRYIRKPVKIGAACALGQGFINTGIRDISGNAHYNRIWSMVENTIVELNDERKLPLPEIAAIAREKLAGILDEKLEGIPFNYTNKVVRIN